MITDEIDQHITEAALNILSALSIYLRENADRFDLPPDADARKLSRAIEAILIAREGMDMEAAEVANAASLNTFIGDAPLGVPYLPDATLKSYGDNRIHLSRLVNGNGEVLDQHGWCKPGVGIYSCTGEAMICGWTREGVLHADTVDADNFVLNFHGGRTAFRLPDPDARIT